MSADISNAPIESWPIEKILPYPGNHKIHSKKQVEALAASIRDQGLNDPITLDVDGYIISGHGRFEAIKLLGWKVAPIRHLKMLSKEKADKLRIAANRTSSNEYDLDVLQRELRRLEGAGEDLTSIGLDGKELDMMLGSLGDIDERSLVADLDTAVEAFERNASEDAKAVEEEGVSITKLFGIKKMPVRAQATATKFMSVIERVSGKTGADALIHHMEGVLSRSG
jgi:ParB-like chromosome segregation protein Spo0J